MASTAVSILNDLIETSRDGEQGFFKAAEDAKDPALKATFNKRAAECAEGARELQSLVEQLGGKPETSGTVAGALHRGWVDLKSAVTNRTDEAILEECERGEDVAKKRYADAVAKAADLPANVAAVVQRQYEGVLRNHNEVKALRDRARVKS